MATVTSVTCKVRRAGSPPEPTRPSQSQEADLELVPQPLVFPSSPCEELHKQLRRRTSVSVVQPFSAQIKVQEESGSVCPAHQPDRTTNCGVFLDV